MAYLALGSNLGDRMALIAAAVRAIDAIDETDVLGVSHVYESEPWGGPDQGPYANAVAVVSTALRADQLLDACQDIEAELGRVRAGARNEPRTIDIDILLFGDEEWESLDLTIPHPRMADRAFVIVPLLEIDPFVTWPDGTPVTDACASLGRITGALGRIAGYEALTPPLRAEGPLEFPSPFVVPDASHEVAPGWVVLEQADVGPLTSSRDPMTLMLHLGALHDAGIEAHIHPPPSFASPGTPYFAFTETVRLLVRPEDVDRARRVLLELRARAADLGRVADDE